jgi:hypothetical protein
LPDVKNDAPGALVEIEPHIAQVAGDGVGAILLKQLELPCKPPQRLDFGLGLHRLNFDGALGFLNALIRERLGHTEIGRHFVVGRVDRRKSAFTENYFTNKCVSEARAGLLTSGVMTNSRTLTCSKENL